MNCIEPAVHLALTTPCTDSCIDDRGFHTHEWFGEDQFRIKEESQICGVHIAIRKDKGSGQQIGKRGRYHGFTRPTLAADNREPDHQ
jgi:hypothetical protein